MFEDVPTGPANNWGTTDDGVCGTGENGDLGNFTGGAGVAACMDSDAIGQDIDAYLCSESIDLSSASGSRLRFLYSYQVFQTSSADEFDVLAGTTTPIIGNMASYTTVYSASGTSKGTAFGLPGADETIPLDAFEGSSIHVCFRYGADNDYYAQVDDIEVRAQTCDGGPPPAVPDNVSATDASFTDKVVVTWDDVTGEDFFEVYRCSTTNTNSCGAAIASPSADVLSYDDIGANPDGTVHY